ncbi:hypothetical protein VTN02DRAFT_4562 [Thermoascus thermophilus]
MGSRRIAVHREVRILPGRCAPQPAPLELTSCQVAGRCSLSALVSGQRPPPSANDCLGRTSTTLLLHHLSSTCQFHSFPSPLTSTSTAQRTSVTNVAHDSTVFHSPAVQRGG